MRQDRGGSRPARQDRGLPKPDVLKAVKQGKEIGPQLVRLPDGRLQVTVFRMTPPGKLEAVPGLHPGWQKITDVPTGNVEAVPAADVPSQPNRLAIPAACPMPPGSGENSAALTRTAARQCVAVVYATGWAAFR